MVLLLLLCVAGRHATPAPMRRCLSTEHPGFLGWACGGRGECLGDPRDLNSCAKVRKSFLADPYRARCPCAFPGRPAAAPARRYDAQDDKPYTQVEFEEFYGGLEQWARSVPEPTVGLARRVDTLNALAYTRAEFEEFYGGLEQWERAEPAPPLPSPAQSRAQVQALRLFKAAVASALVDAAALDAQGIQMLDAQRYPEAVALFQRCASLVPSGVVRQQCLWSAAYSCFLQQRYAEAHSVFRGAVREASYIRDWERMGAAWKGVGTAAKKLRRFSEATSAFGAKAAPRQSARCAAAPLAFKPYRQKHGAHQHSQPCAVACCVCVFAVVCCCRACNCSRPGEPTLLLILRQRDTDVRRYTEA